MDNNNTPQNNATIPETVLLEGHKLDASTQEQYIDKGTFRLYRGEFTGDRKGLAFYYRQLLAEESDDTAVDTKNAQDAIAAAIEWAGPRAVVDAINTIIKNASRARAGQKLPKFDTEAALKEYIATRVVQQPVLITVEEAEAFKLGMPKLSVAGLSKQMAKAMKDGDHKKALEIGKQMLAAVAREQAEAALLEANS